MICWTSAIRTFSTLDFDAEWIQSSILEFFEPQTLRLVLTSSIQVMADVMAASPRHMNLFAGPLAEIRDACPMQKTAASEALQTLRSTYLSGEHQPSCRSLEEFILYFFN